MSKTGRLFRTFCLVASILFATAQNVPDTVRVEITEVQAHRITRPPVVRSSERLRIPKIDVAVGVDETGHVTSARLIDSAPDLYERVHDAETQQRFKPFERGGVPVRASFTDSVHVYPPEQWSATRQPFPEIKDWSTLRIRLDRSLCYGWCPVYSVEIRGEGEVDFEGGRNVAVAGHHHALISTQAVRDLITVFQRADYFSLLDAYDPSVTDVPTYVTSIDFDHVHKSVCDRWGMMAGMPEQVQELEDAIDRIAGTEKWVKGSDQH